MPPGPAATTRPATKTEPILTAPPRAPAAPAVPPSVTPAKPVAPSKPTVRVTARPVLTTPPDAATLPTASSEQANSTLLGIGPTSEESRTLTAAPVEPAPVEPAPGAKPAAVAEPAQVVAPTVAPAPLVIQPPPTMSDGAVRPAAPSEPPPRRRTRRPLASDSGVSHASSSETSFSGETRSQAIPAFESSRFEPPPFQPAPLEPLEPLPGEGKRPQPRWKLVLKWAAFVVAISGLAALLGGFFVVRHYAADLPSVETLKAGYNPPQITRIVARDDTLLAAEFTERRTVVPFDQIPNAVKLAFLAAEDANFYEHEGINYFGLARAFVANLKAGRTVQGGSTITQQVVKNVLLDSSRSLRRKVREFLLALRLEQSLSKDDIFWLYLNHIYLGHARYGVEEAARYYFGKRARELGLDEAATLAGVIASPERYSPRRDPDKALARRRFVMNQMLNKGFVTREVYEQVLQMPLRLAPTTESERRLAPEIVHTAKQAINEALGKGKNIGGYTIHTTIDPELQAAGRQALRANLDRYMERHKLTPPYKSTEIKSWGPVFQGKPRRHKVYVGVVEKVDDLSGVIEVKVGDVVGQIALSTESRYNPTGLAPSEFAVPGAVLRVSLQDEPDGETKPNLRLELGPQSALVAIDVRTREVLANVGSYEALAGGLDRVTQMRRQPGSSFKPVVYSYALHSRRFSPASAIPVKQRGHGVPDEGPLSIDLRSAVAHSNNDAATYVLQEVGPENVVQWGRALGIQSTLQPDLSLALGSYEVTPIELLNAYVTFANGGTVSAPKYIERVLAADGSEAPLPKTPPPSMVLTAEEAYLTTSVLRSVVEFGTGRAAAKLDREVAGKTGTTNDSKDAWFVGYSTDIACAVWVGYDDGLPLGKRESGTVTALPAWIDFMAAAHAKRPRTRFVRPSSILTIHVDPATGMLAGPGQSESRLEEFLPGTEPTDMADVAPTPPVESASPEAPAIPAPPPF
jgi:penicillin-binding protein 1A